MAQRIQPTLGRARMDIIPVCLSREVIRHRDQEELRDEEVCLWVQP